MGIESCVLGSLGRDAESKVSTKGKPYLRLSVAVESGDATTWISAMVFDDHAIEKAGAFTKGSRVYLEGRLSQTEWTTQSGELRHGLSLMCWHCRLSEIGRAKPRREKPKPTEPRHATAGSAFDDAMSDPIPF